MNQKKPTKHKTPNQTAVISQQSFYQGQLPPPEMMARFKEIDPSFPDRIITMAENEANNRHKNEIATHKMLIRTSYMGMIFAFLSVLIISTIVTYAFSLGFATQAATIATGVIVGIAGVFLMRKKITK
ncbi:MAG: hypothetical protein B6D64_10760 [Bacteroidetes bacterium 4484_276]|nr:MAG: hypothetical protein B6D64_10760 [Bacteroidetes bacterium 4484_276]